FLVALKPVLEQYEPHKALPNPAESAPPSTVPARALAMWPLAFPTIVTPYGVAVLIMMVTLRAGNTPIVLQILGVAVGVLVLDLLAMLSADRIVKPPFVASALGIVGTVLSVLQVALGIQAVVAAVRILRVAAAVNGG